MFRIFVVLIAMTALTACGGSAAEQGSSFPDVPAWVDNPAENCAVGSAKHRGNRSLSREASTARARTELAKQLEVKVQSIFKDYGAQGEAEGAEFTEELIEKFSREITDQTLVGTRPTRTKLVGEELYTEVCFNADSLAAVFEGMDKLSQKQREALASRARRLEASLDAQLDKK